MNIKKNAISWSLMKIVAKNTLKYGFTLFENKHMATLKTQKSLLLQCLKTVETKNKFLVLLLKGPKWIFTFSDLSFQPNCLNCALSLFFLIRRVIRFRKLTHIFLISKLSFFIKVLQYACLKERKFPSSESMNTN